MKVETALAKFYDLEIVALDSVVIRIDIHEKGDDCEPLGFLLCAQGLDGVAFYVWRNIWGKVESGTGFTAEQVKAGAKARIFG